MDALAQLPPRVGVGLPADYHLLDLTDPRYRWARRFGVQAAGLTRNGTGTPADPISAIQLTVAVVPDWSTGAASTVDPDPSTVDPAAREGSMVSTVDGSGAVGWGVPPGAAGSSPAVSPAGPLVAPGVGGSREAPDAATAPADDGGWLRPPAYLLVNGLPAAQLVLERRLRPPGAASDIVSRTVEVLVPLVGSGYVVVVTGSTTDPARHDETEWTTLAVAGTLTYRPASHPIPAPPPEEPPIPELRFADTAELLASFQEVAPRPRGSLGVGSLGVGAAGVGSPGSGSLGAESLRAVPAGGAPPSRLPGPPAPHGATIGQAAVDQLGRLVAGHPGPARAPDSA